mmetsp:Transcript_24071/g.48047  ORF Transcript_24071/g.48047 Transcript_24071/m.48047 type:complete len:521 (-) Transcript_24071:1996-3558(-)
MSNLLQPFIKGKSVHPTASVFANGLRNCTAMKSPSSSSSSHDSSILPPKQKLINPATARPHDYYYHPTPSPQLQYALHSAKEAQIAWGERSPPERAAILRRAAEIMSKNVDLLREMETLDTGRTIKETEYDVLEGVECLNYYAGVANSLGGHVYNLPGGRGANLAYALREPLGVTLGIGAWNYPLQSVLWKSAPALAFGNAMIFKPSEYTPSTALWMAHCYHEAGIPDGVFQVVLGGREVGAELVLSPEAAKVSFTGSLESGRNVYEMASKGMKKVTLELGGKSPLIIFDDANIDNAVSGAMMANWYSSGQVCSNGTRVFVHTSIMDQFVDGLVERTKKLRIGDPMDPNTDIGPMAHILQRDKVLAYIDIGVKEGATLLYGGTQVDGLGEEFRDGYFLLPTIFTECSDDMTIVNEEVFGMVMTILSFSTEEEVISRANNTEFGLAAGVFTKDIQRGHKVVQKLKAGATWINNYNLAPMQLPWGGHKHSGVGSENGLSAIEAWTQWKSVYLEMGDLYCPYQ